MPFAHLRAHTEFSVVDGTLRIDDAVGAAHADHQVALAITDLNNLFGAVYGILDTGPESLVPTWPMVLRIEFLEPTGVKWSAFAQNIEPGPNAYQKPQNRGGLERPNKVVFSNDGRTMYVIDYGEVFTDFHMTPQFYTVPKSGVIWTVTKTGS